MDEYKGMPALDAGQRAAAQAAGITDFTLCPKPGRVELGYKRGWSNFLDATLKRAMPTARPASRLVKSTNMRNGQPPKIKMRMPPGPAQRGLSLSCVRSAGFRESGKIQI
jgi:hypothetical protein